MAGSNAKIVDGVEEPVTGVSIPVDISMVRMFGTGVGGMRGVDGVDGVDVWLGFSKGKGVFDGW